MKSEQSLLKRSSTFLRRFSRQYDKPAATSPTTTTTTKVAGPQPQHQKRISRPLPSLEKYMIAHVQAVGPQTPPTRPRFRARPTDMATSSFPTSTSTSLIRTVAWTISLDAEQIHQLVMGFRPTDMDEKWFVYSEGPDRSGKLKVHFHRSWTGHKIAELFVLIDMGGGGGKIVGIKWNTSDQTNGMDEDEAKHMMATTCKWVLGVDFHDANVR